MAECIFCKIAKKEIPAKIVYEDEKTIAFLDVKPASLGHTLVIPKKHTETLDKLGSENLKSLILTVQRISKAISRLSEGYKIIQNNKEIAGQAVDHIHFHIVPRRRGDKIYWNRPNPEFPINDTNKILEKIKSNLNI